jgi:hypothetical protein
MKRLLFVLALVGVGVVGLGFFLGWFHIGSDNADGKSNVTFSVDTDKFHQDEKTAVANVQDVGRQMKDKVAGRSGNTIEGTVVSVRDDKVTMTDKAGKEHGHTLAANAKVTCDGKTCAPADLKAGMRIRLTMDPSDGHAVVRIEALDKESTFASSSRDGKAVRITGADLVMTSTEDAKEHTYTLAAAIAVTCDGKICKAADLKPGMRIRVTSDNATPDAATRIEALDTNQDFEKGA